MLIVLVVAGKNCQMNLLHQIFMLDFEALLVPFYVEAGLACAGNRAFSIMALEVSKIIL